MERRREIMWIGMNEKLSEDEELVKIEQAKRWREEEILRGL